MTSASAHITSSSRSRRGADAPRDLFLDTIRAVAIVRVVTWHTYGWAPITWALSAVPAMIFVSGHLLAQSAERRPLRAVLADRFKRLLIPFWVFGAAAWLIMAAAHYVRDTPETDGGWQTLLNWVLPFNDPRGTVWEGGWLSQPLWYLRVLFWLMLLAPALLFAARRPTLTIAALVAATTGLEVYQLNRPWHPEAAPDLMWRVGDITLYATFFVLGIAAQRHAFDHLRPRDHLSIAFLSIASAVLLAPAVRLEDNVVNNSHVVHLAMGLAWLSIAMAARPAITRFANWSPATTAIRAIGRRSLTIYLWHSGAVITTWHVLEHIGPLPRGVHSALLAAGTVLITIAAVAVFGRVEDLAAGRPAGAVRAPIVPRVLVPALGVALALVALSVTAPRERDDAVVGPAIARAANSASATGATRANAPRVPSQAPRRPDFATRTAQPVVTLPVRPSARPNSNEPATSAPPAERRDERWTPEAATAPDDLAADLAGIVESWASGWGINGIRIAVARPDVFAWRYTTGLDWDGGPLPATGAFDTESITKTFTAAVTWQLWDEGVIDIDEPLGGLPPVVEFPGGWYTVRQLLEHKTGIPDYHDTVAWTPDGYESAIDRAIASALLAPQLADPGAGQFYSSTNYLILGRHLQAVTGKDIDQLIAERLTAPFGITSRFERLPSVNEAPGGGAAGLSATLDSLLVWGDLLLRQRAPLSEAAWRNMARLSESTSLGAGLYGYCPCWYDEESRPYWQRIGHSGGTTSLQYARDYDTIIAVQIPDGVWGATDGALEVLLETLLNRVYRQAF